MTKEDVTIPTDPKTTVNPDVELLFKLCVHMETNKFPDLVLRQFVKTIPHWFSNLTPDEIHEILRSEAYYLVREESQALKKQAVREAENRG